MVSVTLFFLTLALCFCSVVTAFTNSPPRVTVTNGTLVGLNLHDFGQHAFLGIPFAEPPDGNLRFRHPRPYDSNWNIRNATEYGYSCPGYAQFSQNRTMKEDCLTINVVKPDFIKEGDDVPVLVWIYGGGYNGGSSADPTYNLSYIVNSSVAIDKPIIAVSFNYRLSVFGFITGDDIYREGSANAGFFDQRLALKWVQENIAAFGGDHKKVTIWGESAGAFSVAYQTVAFDGNHENLFRAAIMESGTALGPTFAHTDKYIDNYKNLTDSLNCTNATVPLDCLRAIKYEDFYALVNPYVWGPIIDGNFLTKSPATLMNEGSFAPVSLLVGSNTDEGTAPFWGPRGTLNTTEDVRNWLYSLWPLPPATVEEFLKLYPDNPALGCPFNAGNISFADQGLQYKRGAAIAGDVFIQAGRRETAQKFAQKGNTVYSYRFDQYPWNGVVNLIATVAPVYATHYSEIVYVFNNPSSTIPNTLGPYQSDHDLSDLMVRSYIAFVHDLDPNRHGIDKIPYWPEYGDKASNFVFKANSSRAENDDFRKEQLSFISSIWNQLLS
ncbi:alpha/beta-hydrolase [Lipomyces doorenjongii]|uniref:alpha/beta-hydrolase n=1 Tax=Lipomyces doorenjongii TaxID=383834 RepID=UPI0034CFD9EE